MFPGVSGGFRPKRPAEADPNLTVDEGCVVLGDASNVMAKRSGLARACGVFVEVKRCEFCGFVK